MTRLIIPTIKELLKLGKTGGVLFRNMQDLDSASLVKGRHTYLWRSNWNSPRQIALRETNEIFELELDPDTLSPSQVSREFSKQILCLPEIKHGLATLPRAWEKTGENWHYLSLKRYQAQMSWEIDIKSAYFSYLLSAPSLYFLPGVGYKPKPEYRKRLFEASKVMPKLFRLCLFGFWSTSGITAEKWVGDHTSGYWEKFQIKKVFNALVYNACHHAMHDLKQAMKTADEQLNLGCIRCHTDSFILTPNNDPTGLILAFSHFKNRGIKFDLRGEGKTYLLDINTGFVAGRKTLHPEYFMKLPHRKLERLPQVSKGEGIDRRDVDELLAYLSS